MDFTLLHKKLLPNWSAWTVTKSLSSASSLDSIQQSFSKLEKKTKMRILLALLNFDSKTKSECLSSMNELLRLATDEEKNGKWLPIVAGLVHARLLGKDLTGEEENEASAFYHIEETAVRIVEQLTEKGVAAAAQHSLSFQPLELKFLSHVSVSGTGDRATAQSEATRSTLKAELCVSKIAPTEGYIKRHFTYCGEVPDLISKASKSLEERQLTDQKNRNMPAIGKNRDNFRHLLQDNTNDGYSQGSSSLMNSKRLLPSKSSYSISAGSSARGERQASTIMLQDQVDESMQLKAASAALNNSSTEPVSSKRKAPPSSSSSSSSSSFSAAQGDTQPPSKSRIKKPDKQEGNTVLASSLPTTASTSSSTSTSLPTSAPTSTSTASQPLTIDLVSAHKNAALRAVATLLSASGSFADKRAKEKDKEKDKDKDKDKTKDGEKEKEMEMEIDEEKEERSIAVDDAAGGLVSVPLSVEGTRAEDTNHDHVMTSSAPSTATSPVPYPNSIIVPAVTAVAAAPVAATAAPVAAVGLSSMPGGICIDTLFASSPLLSDKDKLTIQAFFSDGWQDQFTASFIAETPVLKIKLQSEEKTGADGQKAKETIYLHLEFSTHSWKKVMSRESRVE